MAPDIYTVIFLLDATPPTKLLLLKRAATKAFAPNWHTGVGGKVEAGEKIIDSAYRELAEETGLSHVHLHPLATCIIENYVTLAYFWGLYKGAPPACDEGDLFWVMIEDLFNYNIIPTTHTVLQEWQHRGFSADVQWRMHLCQIGETNGVKQVEVITMTIV